MRSLTPGCDSNVDHRLRPRRRGARLEPGEHRIDEGIVAEDAQALLALGEIVTDAVHEAVFGASPLDLRFGEDDDAFFFRDMGRQLARLFDARLHATGETQQPRYSDRCCGPGHHGYPEYATGSIPH